MRKLFSTLVLLFVLVLLLDWLYPVPLRQAQCDGGGECAGITVLTPWAAVGGCGAGGSGSGVADGIKWIGKGVDGGLVQAEVLPKLTVGQNFYTLSIIPRFSFKPTWTTTLGLEAPFMMTTSEVQFRSNQEANNRTTGGTGDLVLNFGKSLGIENEFSLSLGLVLPTGQYDIKRGPEAAEEFLPSILQKGGGLYTAIWGLGYSKDVEEGIWLFDLAFNMPFNLSMTGENRYLRGSSPWLADYKNQKGNDRFYYTFKPYGENDFGDFTPHSLKTAVYYGYRGTPGYVHSFGLTLSSPLGVRWMRSEKTDLYDPRPDPDHWAWSGALVYGLEFSRMEYPVFMAFSLPFHDKAGEANASDEYDTSPMKEWNGPDWKDLFQRWTVAFGFKTSMF